MKPILLAALCLFPTLAMAAEAPGDKARLTAGIPVYVHHSNDRSGGREWNEGWFNNEGALFDATWPVYAVNGSTNLRLGATAGAFDNSEFKTSVFAGGVAEIETFATDALAFSLGTYAGAVSGYEDGVIPAIAPYAGVAYAVNERLELGARGFWLPGRTLGGNSVDSDAYIAVATIGTRF